jgi:hypothetical protein
MYGRTMNTSRISRNDMRRFILNSPVEYIEWIQGYVELTTLTYAYDILGMIDQQYWEQALEELRCGLQHQKPYVREGAIEGLSLLMAKQCVQAKEMLEHHATIEKDTDLIELIVDILEQ